MTTIGLDIGVTGGGVIVWKVFASTNRYAGMLAGTYAGATAEVSVAAGVGAKSEGSVPRPRLKDHERPGDETSRMQVR
jgi:Protein of unknown function (DUF992)